MAHIVVLLVTGLYLYSVGRKSCREASHKAECNGCVRRMRNLAWEYADVSALGNLSWNSEHSGACRKEEFEEKISRLKKSARDFVGVFLQPVRLVVVPQRVPNVPCRVCEASFLPPVILVFGYRCQHSSLYGRYDLRGVFSDGFGDAGCSCSHGDP